MRGQLVLQLIICLLWLTDKASATAPSMAKSGCEDLCGNISIPYPFGIGKGCYKDEWFSINCNNHSFHPPKPFLNHSKLNLEVLSIEMGYRKSLTVNSPISSNCRNGEQDQVMNSSIWTSTDLRGSPFLYSPYNDLMVVGCGNVQLKDGHGKIIAGCTSTCNKSITTEGCSYGINCCLTSVPEHLEVYSLSTTARCSETVGTVGYSFAFLAAYNYSASYNNVSDITNVVRDAKYAPLDLSWLTPEPVHPQSCYDNMVQTSRRNYSTYDCYCEGTEEGNPYLPRGCQVVEACAKCKDKCRWRSNSTDGSMGMYYCSNEVSTELKALILGFSIGGGVLSLLVGSFWLYKALKRRREIKLKQKFFKQNGGLLLQQQISSNEGAIEKTKIFTSNELVKATDNFNENRILGQGGQGMVFKGMLVDGRIVAVKKSKIIDKSQVEQFINEIVILSQINHRNVVRLLGCCLETEVPLLVYEFISNGNLFQLIHGGDNEFPLSWEMRLRIATEAAGALAYLHSASSMPIYHRDIKTTNILLDDKYKAKVSDFGTSRFVSIDQTHLSITIQGTFGYLDPEYFQTSQFTEKSDVYSFGVVIVELLTGLKPISSINSEEEKSLVTHFMMALEENSLFDILDARVAKEGGQEEIVVVANLAYRCLNLNGKKRPTMKEVSRELEHFRMPPSSVTIDQENLEEGDYVGGKITGLSDNALTSTRSCLDYKTASSSDVQPMLFIDTI